MRYILSCTVFELSRADNSFPNYSAAMLDGGIRVSKVERNYLIALIQVGIGDQIIRGRYQERV